MNKKEILEKIENEAKKYFVGASGCHDWTHIDRVRNLALRIGKKEKADLFVLEIAALLHDVGRKDELKSRGAFCHAEKGGEIAEKILEKNKIKKDDLDNIVHCIKSHRYKNNNIPETLEAKVLFDADKLDSLGAIGVGRIFLFAGNSSHGSGKLHTGKEKMLAKTGQSYAYTEEDTAAMEYYTKLIYIKNKILTKTGKELAKERQKFMGMFFDRIEKEIKGKL